MPYCSEAVKSVLAVGSSEGFVVGKPLLLSERVDVGVPFLAVLGPALVRARGGTDAFADGVSVEDVRLERLKLLFVGEASEVVGAFLKEQDKHARGVERRFVVVGRRVARLVALHRCEEVAQPVEAGIAPAAVARVELWVDKLRQRERRRVGPFPRLVVVDVLDVADDLDVVLDDPVARVPCGHVVFKRVKVTLPVRLARAGQAAERR